MEIRLSIYELLRYFVWYCEAVRKTGGQETLLKSTVMPLSFFWLTYSPHGLNCFLTRQIFMNQIKDPCKLFCTLFQGIRSSLGKVITFYLVDNQPLREPMITCCLLEIVFEIQNLPFIDIHLEMSRVEMPIKRWYTRLSGICVNN